MKKLTQREKTLLTILFTGLILVVGIIYWIMPMMSDVETLGYEKNDLETKQTDMEVKIAQTTKLLANKEETENEVEAMMARMSDPLLGEVFDLEVQKLTKNNKIKLLSMNYSNTSTTSPSASGTPTQYYEYNLQQLVALVTGVNHEDPEVNETEHEVLKKTATIQVEGTYASIQTLLSDLNSVGKTHYVKSVNYVRTDTESAEEGGLPIKKETATITVDVYFIKLDDSAQLNLSQKG